MDDQQKIVAGVNFFELYKAIHGGCWPGPPPDIRFNLAVNEVISGLALHNLAHSFQDKAVSASVQRVASESLSKSMPALQSMVTK